MFSKDDFKKYFEQIRRLEEDMAVEQGKLIAELSDPRVKAMLSKMREDEKRHGVAVEGLIAMLEPELDA
ncbi:MAG: hypothetical protein WC728_02660 [Elusimicrobiota bacterium]